MKKLLAAVVLIALCDGAYGQKQNKLIIERMTQVGTNLTSMAVNGATTPVIFEWGPGSSGDAQIDRIIMYVEDGGSFDSDKWGNGISITNGSMFSIVRGSTTNAMSSNHSIMKTGDMAALCHDTVISSFGSGNEYMTSRFTFSKAGSAIHLGPNDKLIYNISDNFTDLVDQYIIVEGFYHKTSLME